MRSSPDLSLQAMRFGEEQDPGSNHYFIVDWVCWLVDGGGDAGKQCDGCAFVVVFSASGGDREVTVTVVDVNTLRSSQI
jgi:hypothetical protein